MNSIPDLFKHREQFNVQRKVPCYEHMRRQLYSVNCPKIHMQYAFLKISDNSIHIVDCENAPIKRFPRSEYEKLYEEGHIKVIMCYGNYINLWQGRSGLFV